MKYDICRLVFSFACLLSGCHSNDAIGPVHNKDISQQTSCSTHCKHSGNPSPTTSPPPDTAHSGGQRPEGMSQEVFAAGCTICGEEDAYKRHGSIACAKCKKFICRECHESMKEESTKRTSYDYRNTWGRNILFSTNKNCPFCRHAYP